MSRRLPILLLLALPLAAQTLETCGQHYRSGRLQQSADCYRSLAASTDSYVRAEANWAARRYQDANDSFRQAVGLQPKNPNYRVRWGRLFLDREQNQDAADLFREALELKGDHAGALMGMALAASQGFESSAAELARKALEADPKLVEARVLLATMALEDNNPAQAVEEADKALAIDRDSLEALSVKATVDLLDDKPESAHLAGILKLNPAYGEVYAMAGRFFVLNRRYEEGIELYRKGLELNPRLYKARAGLGLNLMRLGHDEEARKHLVECYEAGETYPAVSNPLRLLDSYKNFRYINSGNIILKLHAKEADLLAPYFEAETRRAVAAYEKKYQMRLDRPVQVEVYPDHEDFAVRILGMPGMG
ncbi:MAG TPA: tetratricopeptide repeat protein, partial [Bryobacteraceae bacterium]|nr:tetratricopeptide repeat protein [Bryobacteraceae bacterium]